MQFVATQTARVVVLLATGIAVLLCLTGIAFASSVVVDTISGRYLALFLVFFLFIYSLFRIRGRSARRCLLLERASYYQHSSVKIHP